MRIQGCLGFGILLIANCVLASDSAPAKKDTYDAANSIETVVTPFVKSVTKTYDKKVVKDLPAHEREPASGEGPSKDLVIHGR